jgi:hypothetical protein
LCLKDVLENCLYDLLVQIYVCDLKDGRLAPPSQGWKTFQDKRFGAREEERQITKEEMEHQFS